MYASGNRKLEIVFLAIICDVSSLKKRVNPQIPSTVISLLQMLLTEVDTMVLPMKLEILCRAGNPSKGAP